MKTATPTTSPLSTLTPAEIDARVAETIEAHRAGLITTETKVAALLLLARAWPLGA